MDTLTHIVLGACIGEAMAGKQLGKKALFLGAIAQSIPDIDFVGSFWLTTAEDLMAHRGFTHSLLFMALVTPILAWVSGYLFKTGQMSFRRWVLFWGRQIFIHLFIDAFNAYGTGWFVPFSDYRVTFNTLFVADPLFSLWPAIAFVVLLTKGTGSPGRIRWVKFGLGLSSLYLISSIFFKLYVDRSVVNDLQARHITYNRCFTTPTPMNNLLWYVVAENDSGYLAGYRSVLDKRDNIDLHFVRRNESFLLPYKETKELMLLQRFSRGYYSAEMWHDTLVFNNLCFGEIVGWCEEHPKFVCHYYMQYPHNNEMIVQRGRFAKWDKRTFSLFIKRIMGN